MKKLYFIGIDVSKEKLSCFDGKEEFSVKNDLDLEEFKRLLRRKYKDLKRIALIFEATGIYSYFLKAFCNTKHIKAYILNPKKTPNLAKVLGQRSKTDKIDARTIYCFKDLISKEQIKVPQIDETLEKIYAYFSSYKFLIKQRVALSNHLDALERNPFAPRDLMKRMQERYLELRAEEKRLMEKMEQIIAEAEDTQEDLSNLCSIKGIGINNAICLLILFKRYQVENRQQVTALLGFDVKTRQSGTSVYSRGQISKQGNGMMRSMLYMAALNAVRTNLRMKFFYKRLIDRGKPRKVALMSLVI